jgi:ketosteroid isomerase-like protein
MKRLIIIAILFPACAPAPEPSVDLQAEEAAIRELSEKDLEAYNNKDIEAVMSHLAEDHVAHEPNRPPYIGRESQRASIEGFFKILVSENWEITKIEISASGDMAYVLGSYQMVVGGDDDPVEDEGKYLSVLKKINGEWKYVALSISSNKPLR